MAMEPAAQPEVDEYVLTTEALEKVDRDLVDNEALQAVLDRILRKEPVTATAFANFVS
jgi:hypothetical protein